ncbi:hypothetical protein [Streptomyces pactum]|uniref:Uncharacterized protein n=1 Tax=Streptomyces pactum TaxID=68249 RepID=A0A1S6JGI8_9ACTN|nr:hypothetical protein [Streptomyces pactum]AQS70873.1 hypothetical protein B1H29_31835 [Streptomyces pactum]
MTDHSTSYFIQSRPVPGQPWAQHGVRWSWQSKPKALEKLAARREMKPGWEHRLMERITTVVERPATEDATPEETAEACGKCQRPFNPDDPRWDGSARYASTPYCRGCIDRCHDSTDAFHVCVICR